VIGRRGLGSAGAPPAPAGASPGGSSWDNPDFMIAFSVVFRRGVRAPLTKKIALLFRDRAFEALENEEHVFPDFALLGAALVPQQIGWMKGDHQGRLAVRMPAAAQLPHRLANFQEPFDRRRSECDQHFRFDDFDLLGQVGKAGLHLGGSRLPIAGLASGHVRSAFQDVGDVDLVAGEAHCRDDSGEQLTGATNERFTLAIFIRAGGFADEH